MKTACPACWSTAGAAPPAILICQFQSAGVDAWKVPIVQALLADTGCPNVFERCDELIRKSEGLPVFYRPLAGEEPPDHVLVTENGAASAWICAPASNTQTAQLKKFRRCKFSLIIVRDPPET
jgi:hypothetical protein